MKFTAHEYGRGDVAGQVMRTVKIEAQSYAEAMKKARRQLIGGGAIGLKAS